MMALLESPLVREARASIPLERPQAFHGRMRAIVQAFCIDLLQRPHEVTIPLLQLGDLLGRIAGVLGIVDSLEQPPALLLSQCYGLLVFISSLTPRLAAASTSEILAHLSARLSEIEPLVADAARPKARLPLTLRRQQDVERDRFGNVVHSGDYVTYKGNPYVVVRVAPTLLLVPYPTGTPLEIGGVTDITREQLVRIAEPGSSAFASPPVSTTVSSAKKQG